MTLYKITNKLGNWFVLGNHPTEATELLEKVMQKADYKHTPTTNIEIIARQAEGVNFIGSNRLITQSLLKNMK